MSTRKTKRPCGRAKNAGRPPWYIGDGVIATDILGRVTFMNTVAQDLTGWKTGEANQKPIAEVFNIVNETTRQKAENPVDKVLQLGTFAVWPMIQS